MSGTRSLESRLADLRAAMRVSEIDRRALLTVAGAAAVSAGLTRGTASANTLPGPRTERRGLYQAANNGMIFGSGQDISNLDPHTGHDYSITWGQKAVYDSVLRYDENPAVLKPLLATEVTGNTDASEWTIKLDPAATFHDGSTVDAEAVKYNFGRMLRKNLGVAWMFAEIMTEDSAVVVDPTTLKVTLTKSFAPFDAVLPWLFVANPKIVQEHDVDGDEGEAWLKDHEAGGGPFTIGTWDIGSSYEFTRFADYWWKPEGITPLETFTWRIIRESSTKRIAQETGEIQYGDTYTPEDVEALATNPLFVANEIASITPMSIKLNNQAGPTADLNVRKALAHAFDYDAAIEVILGRGEIMQGPLATGLAPWHRADLPVLRFDMDAAKAALAASAYKDGFEMEYVYVTGLAEEENFGLILLETAAELGITVTMTPLVWPDMVARASKAETSPAAMAVYAASDYPDPDNYLWQAYHSSQAGFWSAASHYINPEMDKLLEDARSSTDEATRKELYDQAQLQLVNDAVEIWVYTDMPNEAWVKELHNPQTPVMGGDVRNFYFMSS